MDARQKQQTIVPQAQQIKEEAEEQGESRSEAPRGVMQRGGKGNITAPAVVKAACKRKEAVVDSVPQRHAPAISAQKTKAMEKKKKEGLVAAQKGKAAVKVAPKTKQVISSDEEEEEEDNSSDEDYEEEGESVDEDSDDDSEEEEEEELVAREPPPVTADEVVAEEKLAVLAVHEQQQHVEEPVVVEEAHERDDDGRTIVRVRKFEGCSMLAEVERTQDGGVASRTRRRKVLNLRCRQNLPLDYNKDSKGTFSDPVDV